MRGRGGEFLGGRWSGRRIWGWFEKGDWGMGVSVAWGVGVFFLVRWVGMLEDGWTFRFGGGGFSVGF